MANLQDMFEEPSPTENHSIEPMPLQAPWFVAEETSDAGYLEADAVLPIDPSAPEATQEEQTRRTTPAKP